MTPKKDRNPITTEGWIRNQANGIIRVIDEAIVHNEIDARLFTLQISANVIRNLCNITIIPKNGNPVTATVRITEKYNPFDNTHYWNATEKILMKRYSFSSVKKIPNMRMYEFHY